MGLVISRRAGEGFRIGDVVIRVASINQGIADFQIEIEPPVKITTGLGSFSVGESKIQIFRVGKTEAYLKIKAPREIKILRLELGEFHYSSNGHNSTLRQHIDNKSL